VLWIQRGSAGPFRLIPVPAASAWPVGQRRRLPARL